MASKNIGRVAASQGHLLDRTQALETAGSDTSMRRLVAGGSWLRRQQGVYQVDTRPQSFTEGLWAAVLAGGEGTVVSHRAALVVWGLDGISSAPIEVTVSFGNLPVPQGTIVHRTRRLRDVESVDGLPITSVPRTLLDCSSLLPPIAIHKAVDSALRLNLTSLDRLADILSIRGGRGVKGTRMFRNVLSHYSDDTSTGSGGEVELLYLIRRFGLPEPELQREFITRTGRRAIPDFYWPDLNKAVEVDGLDAHSSADALDDDLQRQNELLDLGIELRRFSARRVRRDPLGVIADLRLFLGI